MSLTMGCDGLDLSLLNPTQFRLVFNKIPNVQFFCQSISIPELSLAPVTQSTNLLDLFHPGEKVRHQPLFAEVLLDKEMKTYEEIYTWMKNLSVLHNATEGFSDCDVIIGARTFHFQDVWPINLAQINLNIAVPSVQAVTFGVTFEYDLFTMK